MFFTPLKIFSGQYRNHYDEEARCVEACYRDYNGDLDTTITGKKCREWRIEDIASNYRHIVNVG